jgi:hypothetical protein
MHTGSLFESLSYVDWPEQRKREAVFPHQLPSALSGPEQSRQLIDQQITDHTISRK